MRIFLRQKSIVNVESALYLNGSISKSIFKTKLIKINYAIIQNLDLSITKIPGLDRYGSSPEDHNVKFQGQTLASLGKPNPDSIVI